MSDRDDELETSLDNWAVFDAVTENVAVAFSEKVSVMRWVAVGTGLRLSVGVLVATLESVIVSLEVRVISSVTEPLVVTV